MRGVPRARRAISLAPSALMPMPSTRAPRVDDLLQLLVGIEAEPDRNAEAVAQRIGEQPGARGRADQVNGASSIFTERAAGPSPMMRSSWKSSIAG